MAKQNTKKVSPVDSEVDLVEPNEAQLEEIDFQEKCKATSDRREGGFDATQMYLR